MTANTRGDEAPSEAATQSATARRAEYARKNPLGGPATMFEEMAERIRSGEDYYAVLEDYGLRHVDSCTNG